MDRVKRLTDLQMDVMKAVWKRGEATVAQVHASLLDERNLAMTTIATLLSRLEKHSLLDHRVDGRQYVYRPLVSMSEVRRSRLAELTDQFFQGNPADLAFHLLSESDVSEEDLTRILALIESKEDGNSDN